jgi:hypothetical protein
VAHFIAAYFPVSAQPQQKPKSIQLTQLHATYSRAILRLDLNSLAKLQVRFPGLTFEYVPQHVVDQQTRPGGQVYDTSMAIRDAQQFCRSTFTTSLLRRYFRFFLTALLLTPLLLILLRSVDPFQALRMTSFLVLSQMMAGTIVLLQFAMLLQCLDPSLCSGKSCSAWIFERCLVVTSDESTSTETWVTMLGPCDSRKCACNTPKQSVICPTTTTAGTRIFFLCGEKSKVLYQSESEVLSWSESNVLPWIDSKVLSWIESSVLPWIMSHVLS